MHNHDANSNHPVHTRPGASDNPRDRRDVPAMLAFWLIETFACALQRWRLRRSLRALLARDDHILSDLGTSRAQLYRQLKQPDKQMLSGPACERCPGQ